MLIKRLFFILLSLIALVAASNAQITSQISPSSTQPHKASLPADLINYFSGDWTGKGKFITSGRELESDYSFSPDLGNQILVVRHKEKPPNDYVYLALWSVDSISGDLVMLLASNHDAGARLFRSKGWESEKVTFQSVPDLRAPFALERVTFSRESPTTFRTIYEMSRDDGKTWRGGDQQAFVRKS